MTSPATTYGFVLERLAALRAALAADARRDRPLAEVRRDHEDLDRLLAHAIAQAFAADASGAPEPAGVSSWVSEGLARSREREMALFAAGDLSGVRPPTTTADQHRI